MILRLGYDIQFELPAPVAMVALLNLHPSRAADLRAPDELRLEPASQTESYIDTFGNRCIRFFVAQPGLIRLSNSTLVYDSGLPDPVRLAAREVPVEDSLKHFTVVSEQLPSPAGRDEATSRLDR
jgi:transglutaminase-like putative cysteine protease